MCRLQAVLLTLAVSSTHGFHAFTTPRALPSRTRTIVASDYEGVVRLSEIEEDDPDAPKPWETYKQEQEGAAQEGVIQTSDYSTFIDDDGFDGGDGQVGVVGDGKNHMEEFDMTRAGTAADKKNASVRRVGESIGGSESKKTRGNVFGYTTGYADKLKEQGMTRINEYGEDELAARRQQLENWQNQRALKAEQEAGLKEMAQLNGAEYNTKYATKSYHDALNAGAVEDESKWNVYKAEKGPDVLPAEGGVVMKGEITETIEMTCQFPSPSFGEIKVHNDVMSFEDFVVGFSPDSDVNDFQVSPLNGQLSRAGGDPSTLSVVFKPQSPGGVRNLFVVVDTEESKFTYHIIGSVM